jgi:hypothetical protein
VIRPTTKINSAGAGLMTIFVAEIAGRAIAAFHVETPVDARHFGDEELFRADLMVLESGGRPLWDGKSEIRVREAHEEEADAWRSSRARAILAGDILSTDIDDDWLTYLVPVSDPTDSDDET